MPHVAVPMLLASEVIQWGSPTVSSVNQLSLRPTLVSDRLQGRVAATVRVPTAGSAALGGLLGGFLGSAAGPGPTLVVASGGMGLAVLWVALSPLRRLRQVEESSGGALKPLRIPVGRRFPCGSPDAGGASLAHRPAPGYDAEPIRPRRAGKQMQHVRQESGVHDR